MTREEIKDFTARISQTNRSGLVVISYEMMLTYIRHAKEELAEAPEVFVWNLKQAKSVLEELMNALDFDYAEIANELMSLYLFIQKQLNSSIFKKEDVNLASVENIINKLKVAFEKVAEEDTTGPVMQNTSKLYVGLTYNKDMQSDITETKQEL
ncbi:MAG: flagellar protein FliS [Lachnospiraceae bacterium]|nr:flagellar protein FliS [Lachnospiraceae bacterium]